ncbi:alpha/beta fold hydrolase [Rhodococcus spongiicola]|uniref:Alpha/beta fold hydrolase n=2 Tax=Rhodococcus spongiicola TaxID=2487352 RepID=A0A3S3ALW5_9NOCA|nr:alpha/beta fold hydrolase [Rhodococcus spongiicola]
MQTAAVGAVTVVMTVFGSFGHAASANSAGVGRGPGSKPLTYVAPSSPGPVQIRHDEALRYAEQHPDSVPLGANDFDCRPGPRHPNPVVLAHGSDSDAYTDWAALSPMLAAQGFCVFVLNYGADGKPGKYGRGDMASSAGEVADFVERVRASTGADRVDLIGYSQGATVTRYFVNRLGGADVVNRWVGMASPTYGGTMFGIVPLLQLLPYSDRIAEFLTSKAVSQHMRGSPFLTALNAGGDTVPGVQYTTIGSRYDEMIQPYTNIALRGPGAVNLVVQDLCAEDQGGHFSMVYDPFVLGLVVQVLDPSAPSPACVPVPLGYGILDMMIASNS